MDNAGRGNGGAREENKFRLVEDAVGLGLGFFQLIDPIHRSGIGIKIFLQKDRDVELDAEFAEPDENDFSVSTFGGDVEVGEVNFDCDAGAVETDASDSGCSAAEKRVEDEVVFAEVRGWGRILDLPPWSAPAERSGDGALDRLCGRPTPGAVSPFDCHRPQILLRMGLVAVSCSRGGRLHCQLSFT